MPSLNTKLLSEIVVYFPSLPEQRAIARILRTLDDKIELNRRMNETLESMARAIFKDWFVDFGPVHAKADDREPYLSSEIWDLFSREFDQGGKPRGWHTSEIGRETRVVGGSTPSTKNELYWQGGRNYWATPRDLSGLQSPVLLDTAKKITDAGIEKISSRLLPQGTVLLSSRAPIGYLAIAEVPTAINQGFIALICEKKLSNVFVLNWCKEYLEYIKSLSGGTTFGEISKKVFRPISVVVPPSSVLSAFESIVRPKYLRMVSCEREIVYLTQIRDTLLPKLISGEIRIEDAEKMVDSVA